jgi:hypothetical protein
MEFLMTYGWAILVVLVVIGALAYFGVLNPQSFLPKRCTLSAGFSCPDVLVKANAGSPTIQLQFINGLSNPIELLTFKVIDTQQSGALLNCGPTGAALALTAGQQTELKAPLLTCLGSAVTVGQRIKATISFQYKDMATGYTHSSTGDLITDVE